MNIMFASVMERIKEIGTRLAIGAQKRDIVVQFLAEAVLISVSGGLLGVIIGIFASWLITNFADIATIVTPVSVIISFAVSATVGVVFGYSPAKRASERDPGSCFNIGLVDGGTKSNVIAGRAFVHWSARLRPGESNESFLRDIQACAEAEAEVNWEVPFHGEPLPAAGQGDREARAWCASRQLEVGEPVDFWTEASLFSAAGLPAVVLGPGHIAQAHQTDEWVALEQLQQALDIYAKLVKADD